MRESMGEQLRNQGYKSSKETTPSIEDVIKQVKSSESKGEYKPSILFADSEMDSTEGSPVKSPDIAAEKLSSENPSQQSSDESIAEKLLSEESRNAIKEGTYGVSGVAPKEVPADVLFTEESKKAIEGGSYGISTPEKPKNPEVKEKEVRPEEKEKSKSPDAEELFKEITEKTPGWFSQKAHAAYEKLSEAGKKFAGWAYDHAKTSILGRIGVGVNKKFEDYHEWYASRDKADLSEINAALESDKSKEKKLEEILAMPTASEAVKAKAQKELLKIREDIAEDQNKRDKAQSRLEYRNRMKMAFENERKAIVEHMVGIINERMAPHETKFESLESKKNMLDSEIVTFRDQIKKFESRADELERAVEASDLKAEKMMLKEQLKTLKDALKESRVFLKNRSDQRVEMEKSMAARKEKIDYWQNIRNEYNRMTGNRTPQYKVGDRQKVEGNYEFGTSVAGNEATKENSEESKEVPETLEEKTSVTMDDYIGEWNKYFRSQFEIKPESMAEFVKTLPQERIEQIKKLSEGEKADAKVFEDLISGYHEWIQKNGSNPTKLSKKDIERRFKTMRVYLETK